MWICKKNSKDLFLARKGNTSKIPYLLQQRILTSFNINYSSKKKCKMSERIPARGQEPLKTNPVASLRPSQKKLTRDDSILLMVTQQVCSFYPGAKEGFSKSAPCSVWHLVTIAIRNFLQPFNILLPPPLC